MRSQKSYMRVGTVHKLTAGAASSQSAAFGNQTTVIRVASGDNGFYFRYGKGAQTAIVTDSVMPPGDAEYFLVKPGEQIAVIRSGASDAIVTVTEMDA